MRALNQTGFEQLTALAPRLAKTTENMKASFNALEASLKARRPQQATNESSPWNKSVTHFQKPAPKQDPK